MPTYEYECKSCGHTFEVFQSMNEESLKNCPQCGREIRRLIHGGTGVIFKGSGFYVTDKSKGVVGGSTGAKTTPKPAGTSSNGGASASKGTEAPAAGGKEKTSPPTS